MFKVVAIDLLGFAKFVKMDIPTRDEAIEFGKQYAKDNADTIDSWQVMEQRSTDYLQTAAKKWVKI